MSNLKYLLLREKIIRLIRSFFYAQGFHEIITPVLNQSVPLEPNIYPFETVWKTTQDKKKFFLSTSPEKNLKKILALGIEKCFSIGHSFRNLEASGPLHTPEFLMLEWYRKNANYTKIMNDTKNLLKYLSKKIKPSYFNVLKHFNKISLVYLFKKYCLLDLKKVCLDDRELFNYAVKNNYQIKNANWCELYDQIFVNKIEPHLPKNPCFIVDFPSRISPLCQPKKTEPYLAERFELYINRIELANGNTENTDIDFIKKKLRKPLDLEFLNSLKKMQDTSYAGVGLGVDRLTLIFCQPKKTTLNLTADDNKEAYFYTA